MTENNTWFSRLSPLQQLAISFVLYGCLSLVFQFIGEATTLLEPKTWSQRLFHAAWSSFFLTIYLNWKLIKGLFHKSDVTKIG